jgi:lipopolysaccharide heptosyltransferase I
MKILIVKTSAIGDVTHTLPCLNALRQEFPKAHIAWLIEEDAAEIIRNHPDLDQIIVSKRKRWIKDFKAGKRWQTISQILNFLKEIRRNRYDLLIDFQGLLKSSALIALCRAKRKAGFGKGMEHSECSYLFLNKRIPPVDMDIHAVERELLLLKALGIKTGEATYKLPIADTAKAEAKALLKDANISADQPLIAINPMTTWPTKHWHNEGFAELADGLLDNHLNVVFTGGPGDKTAIAKIIDSMRGTAVNLAGKTSLKTLAALYSLANIVISTDTGPMHIAAATGTPVIAIFGPTAPWRTGPYGNQHKVIRTNISCSPCFKKSCERGDHACMLQISASEVLDTALQISVNQRK